MTGFLIAGALRSLAHEGPVLVVGRHTVLTRLPAYPLLPGQMLLPSRDEQCGTTAGGHQDPLWAVTAGSGWVSQSGTL